MSAFRFGRGSRRARQGKARGHISPTASGEAVSREIMAEVAEEIAKLEALLHEDIEAINAVAAERRLAHVAG
jgi:hypothetical protein